MAADIQKTELFQRSNSPIRSKLITGSQVEVRSVEDGFQGSWHSATVTVCDNDSCIVEYHNLLSDNSEKLVESVKFTPVTESYRGLIRPLPPKVDIDILSLPFGLCVDVFHNDAWWEGVIFDHNNGSEERLVFFPDIGDDMRADMEILRVTQDWDKDTEDWNSRGNWVFLELIEEIEQEWPLFVSVKQIWYELRMKNGFENLKEWTCQMKSSWKELVLGVIADNFNLTLKEFFHKINLSGFLEHEGLPLELKGVTVGSIMNPSAEEAIHHDDTGLPGFSEALSNKDKLLSIGSSSKTERVLSNTHNFGKLKRSKCSIKKPWLLADIAAENCPFAITDYIRQCKYGRPSLELLPKVRQYLSHMGWTIEFMKDNKDNYRYRYTSPSGETYFSLNKICEDLKDSPTEMICSDDERSLVSKKMLACKKTYTDSSPSEALVVRPEWCHEEVEGLSHLHSHSKASLSGPFSDKEKRLLASSSENPSRQMFVNHKQRKDHEWLPANSDMLPQPECCPDAITQCQELYKSGGKMSKVIKLNVLKHLSYLGWKFENRKDKKSKIKYTAPNGKWYFSLRKLCEAWSVCNSESNLQPSLAATPSEGLVTPTLTGKEWQGKKCKLEPEYSLKAVEDYYHMRKLKGNADFRKFRGELKQMHLKVKKHLLAANWSVFYIYRGENRVLKYMSPSGKSAFNLLSACKICLKEAGTYDADVYALGLRKQPVNAIKEDESEGQLAIEKQCSPLTESSGTSLSRELVEMYKAKEIGVRKLRFKRKNGVLSLDVDWLQRENPNSSSPRENQENEFGSGSNSSGPVLRSSKRAREVVNPTSSPRTILSWLIENKVVLPRAKVQYRSHRDGSAVIEGRATLEGIKCNCCQSCFSLSKFEAHAGITGHHASANIFLEDGRSILDCQIQLNHDISLKRSKSESSGPRRSKGNRFNSRNDYICSVCHFGGELILCDQCPSSFHTHCVGLKEVPDGDWFCPSCCCGICGQSKFEKNTKQLNDCSSANCEQCQRQYHVGCLKEKKYAKLESSPKGSWFCNTRCKEIFMGIHQLLGKPVPLGMNNLTWTLLKYTPSDIGNESDTEDLETYSKLNLALSVMHECFEPVKEPSTRRDLVEDVIFCRWSELNRLNFRGFYTVLLERDDELISAATVRIYGEKVAEVPLVATRFQYRRLGMCRILMDELERKLMELGVERLVLPAVPSVLDTWTTSFGFSVMTKPERLYFLHYSFLNFQGTSMCQKLLKSPSSPGPSMIQGTELKVCDNGTDVVDLDGGSAVSEVLQAERTVDCGIPDQGLSHLTRSGSIEGVISTRPLDLVNLSPRTECQSTISMDCLVGPLNKEDDHYEYNNNGNNALFKCYKRRKLAAAAACGS